MQGKRGHERFLVEGLEIKGKMMFAARVKILNISLSGVAIETDKRLDIGSEYSLTIEDRDGVLSVKGVVVWSRVNGHERGLGGHMIPIYIAGMKFRDPINEGIEKIIRLAEDHMKGEDTEDGGRHPV